MHRPNRRFPCGQREEVDGDDTGALLQSYMDAVLQGFRNEYGDEGVSHFVDTTANFNRRVIADRERPLYPRSVDLTDAEKSLFDAEIMRAGVLSN